LRGTRTRRAPKTALHVHQQLDGHFGFEKWREAAAEKSRAISRFVFQFAVDGDIQRPAKEIEFERIEQITRSYQYMMIKEGGVLVRRYSCWCLPHRPVRS
jgi:hypothetical protein